MKFFSKLLIILFITIFAFGIVPQNVSFAGKISNFAKATDPANSGISVSIGDDLSSKVIKKILALLQIASALITIVVLAFTGFNYITSQDAEMKSEIKKRMLPILIGLVLVFSATTVTRFILAVVGAK